MKIVINGASIAGLSTAAVLGRTGHDVTLIEHSRAVRSGGIAVDVRGEALDVAVRLGISDELQRNRVGYGAGFEFIDSRGQVDAIIEPNESVYDSPDDLEISRDALAGIITSAIPESVNWVLGSTIDDITELPDGRASVCIRGQDPQIADLVVGADGLHSRVRRLAFGLEREFLKYLGLYVGVLRRCTTSIEVPATTVYNEPGRLVLVRGDGRECSAVLGFTSEWMDYDYHDIDAQRTLMISAFDGVDGWRTPELVAEVEESDDFYFDSVCQVIMSSWHQGPVVLVGDSGYCASFFSGMGTSLAMQGAMALGDALEAEGDVRSALDVYGARMRPVVDAAQAIAAEGTSLLFPRGESEIAARNARADSPIATA
ncbi:FAD-dependent monooxygenase [Brevibacterium sp. FAM 25378]|uniref:FAD-dependent monooxygenase n=1 Tax=unclassified Brevibacterium TaxID=2614124 RepID=UPI001092E3F9|nr:FAD-dependent monooxygenase [Brevibacterium sp. S22]TGD32113.1 monooxygenase [Brevibacterium sp. S22]